VSYKELGKAVEKLPSHLPTDLKKPLYQVLLPSGKRRRKNNREKK
jgi:hypothetical protein